MKRDLNSLDNLTKQEITDIFNMSSELKNNKGQMLSSLSGKTIGLLFQKPSNRTRVSFEVGIWQLGGNCVYLGPDEINLGKRESIHDVAKTLSRYLDCIVARTYSHQDVLGLGEHAGIPIINGLSDLFHPCQALTDIFSIKEKFNDLKKVTLAYVGDGNNVCHSLLLGCSKIGIDMRVATPVGYEPDERVVQLARSFNEESSESSIFLTNSAQEAVEGSNVIYADVWTSMGQEKENDERLKVFKNYQINSELIKFADKDYIFMHCLPAHRGQEVTSDIIDGKHSIVFDQAENRMHVQKAILIFLLSSINSEK